MFPACIVARLKIPATRYTQGVFLEVWEPSLETFEKGATIFRGTTEKLFRYFCYSDHIPVIYHVFASITSRVMFLTTKRRIAVANA